MTSTEHTNPAADFVGQVRAISERLDHAKVEAAALWAARQLDSRGVARVNLAPGDATLYQFTIVAPSIPQYPEGERAYNRRDYVVSLGGPMGATYPWAADAEMHPSYCAEKWTPRGTHHTDALYIGTVVALFLNRVHARLTF
jgi:hypothetical protein